MPHFAFLHERFLFRFGHDRTMLLHGRELVRRGHRVSFVGYRLDEDVIAAFGGEAIALPAAACEWAELDAYTARMIDARWPEVFAAGVPDAIVNGGWPFYASAQAISRRGVGAVYFDAGATPLEGLAQADLPVHRALRNLRRRYIGLADATVSVSHFIASSQTLPDAPETPNHVILNAVDHLDDPLWTAEGTSPPYDAAAVLGRARDGGRAGVLHLGRWEGGYKNKAGALQVMDALRARGVEAALIVLADADPDLSPQERHDIVFAAHPDDADLKRLMQGVDAGISASLWEGFNLALAEMHRLGRPAYALDIGAHREAAIDAAYVCTDLDQMTDRLTARLIGPARPLASPAAIAAYEAQTRWARAGGELEAILLDGLDRRRRTTPAEILVMDVTNASRDPANSGVVRVTRRLGRALQDVYRVQFVVFDEALADYRLPTPDEARTLGRYDGPRLQGCDLSPTGRGVTLARALARRGWSLDHTAFLLAETVLQPRVNAVAAWLARERVELSAVLHDVIPLSHPQFTDRGIVEAFGAYVALLKGARCLLANSHSTAQAWVQACGEGPEVVAELLPGDFGPRGQPKDAAAQGDPIVILTVSTLEPRKNHATLLDAFELAQRLAPELDLRLDLVGNGYEGGDGVLDAVRARAAANSAIRYQGVVDDARLRGLYAAADFTVYPSLVEGFGLPILESVWRARPVVCHCEGATAEVAAGGGALTCDAADPASLAEAIVRLARDAGLRRLLSLACTLRQVRTWDDYARACLDWAVMGRDVRDGARDAA